MNIFEIDREIEKAFKKIHEKDREEQRLFSNSNDYEVLHEIINNWAEQAIELSKIEHYIALRKAFLIRKVEYKKDKIKEIAKSSEKKIREYQKELKKHIEETKKEEDKDIAKLKKLKLRQKIDEAEKQLETHLTDIKKILKSLDHIKNSLIEHEKHRKRIFSMHLK